MIEDKFYKKAGIVRYSRKKATLNLALSLRFFEMGPVRQSDEHWLSSLAAYASGHPSVVERQSKSVLRQSKRVRVYADACQPLCPCDYSSAETWRHIFSRS